MFHHKCNSSWKRYGQLPSITLSDKSFLVTSLSGIVIFFINSLYESHLIQINAMCQIPTGVLLLKWSIIDAFTLGEICIGYYSSNIWEDIVAEKNIIWKRICAFSCLFWIKTNGYFTVINSFFGAFLVYSWNFNTLTCYWLVFDEL